MSKESDSQRPVQYQAIHEYLVDIWGYQAKQFRAADATDI